MALPRVPAAVGIARAVFDELLAAADSNPAFRDLDRQRGARKTSCDSVGRGNACQPLIQKLAGAIFVITKNVTFGVASAMAGLGEPTLKAFFTAWQAWCRASQVPKHVYMPQGDHLAFIMYCYARMGFPGACCSTDGVHVLWAKCPAAWKWVHTGEKKSPSRVYNISVGPNTEVFYVPPVSFPGRTNDKTAAQTHYVLRGLQEGVLYAGASVSAECVWVWNGLECGGCFVFPRPPSTRRYI